VPLSLPPAGSYDKQIRQARSVLVGDDDDGFILSLEENTIA
jgi:hypothetical protein